MACMGRYAVLIGAVVLVLVAGLWIGSTNIARAPGEGQACTMEAKLCPDGSYVGRTGPNCEFAECPTYNSGVRGTVLLGPTCPVMREPPDPQCADKPYATTITVRRTGSGAAFATGTSDASGAFQFLLPPGPYTFVAEGGATLPRCSETSATVLPDIYGTVTISCDTGIR